MGFTNLDLMVLYDQTASFAIEDLSARVKLDPAVDSPEDTIRADLSFQAILAYRIANCIYYDEEIDSELRMRISQQICEYSKKITNIDIHPGAQIGERFVVDHGVNTVIGSTAQVGTDCTIIGERFHVLQGVILGAYDVDNNIVGKRHPTVGNHVTICGCTRIFGPINIGDHVTISPCSVIIDDIPAYHDVVIVNQLQLCKQNGKGSLDGKPRIKIYGVVPCDDNIVVIHGFNLKGLTVKLVNYDMQELNEVQIIKLDEDVTFIKFKLHVEDKLFPNNTSGKIDDVSIKLENEQDHVYITKSLGLRDFFTKLSVGA